MKLRTLFLSLPILMLITTNCFAEDFEKMAKIILNGEASIQKEADQMEVNLGVVTSGKNSGEALTQNNQLMAQVIANLKELGLEESEYQTCHFHIQPYYQRSPEGYDDHAVISGYEIYNSIHVKTLKLYLADKILSAAVQGGVNQVNQINFSLHNPQMYCEEAIQAATQKAIADANTLAKAAGVKIKRILTISLNHWQTSPTPYMVSKSYNGEHTEVGHDRIEPGKAKIHATVNVIFEIKK